MANSHLQSEKQLLTLVPATLEQEEYLYERNTGKSFDSPDDYAAYISETGGDAAKALKVADSAVPEWEAKNNTRAKARQPLLKLKRNVDGNQLTPITREVLQLMAKPFIRHKVASIAIPNR